MGAHVNTMKIRQVTTNGQVCIGQKYSGKQVQVSELDNGSILISPGNFIPDNERWLYQGDNIERLNKAIAQAKSRPRGDNFKEIERRVLENG